MSQKRTQRKLTPAQRRAQEAIENIARSSPEPTRKVLDFLLSGSHDQPPLAVGSTPASLSKPVNDISEGKDNSLLRSRPDPDQTQTRPRPANLKPAAHNQHKADNPDQTQTRSKIQANPIAPQNDFNRRANSIEREFLPAGFFPGSSKSLYDALYLRTRGAIQPVRTVKATRRDLMKWTGVKNIKTINANINRLTVQGLIKHKKVVGDQLGSIYEVFLPEETDPDQTQTRPRPDPDRKMDLDQTQKMDWVGSSQIIENTVFSEQSKTSLKTDDETHTLQKFTEVIADAARSVVGGKLNTTEQEQERWKELGEAIANELVKATRRTDTISSVPAFFTEHLRRRLAQKARIGSEEKKTPEERPSSERPATDESKDGFRQNKVTPKNIKHPVEVNSKFSLDECRRYAEHLSATGQGITNPGGFAMTIYRSGEADELIATFLQLKITSAKTDHKGCPRCHGTGMEVVEGKGARRCTYNRQAEQETATRDATIESAK